MGRLAVAVVVALLAAVLAAGCAGGPSADTGGGVDDGLGVLAGVVVDDAIRPLSGAVVRLPAAGVETNTTADGQFRFEGLALGAVAITVTKAGFVDAALTGNVLETGGPTLRIQLEPLPSGSPYYSAYLFEGFIDCGTGHFAACGAPFAVQTILCGNGGPCTDNVTDGKFITFHDLERAPDLVQSEVVWESTQPFGDSLVLILFSSTPEQRAGFSGTQLNETVGPSPVLGKVDAATAAENGLGINASLAIGVYGGKYCGVQGVCHENVGLVLQQRFKVFTHVFYHYLPPADWRFTTEGTVPPPPA